MVAAMKRTFVRAAVVVGLLSGLVGCKALRGGSETAATPAAPAVEVKEAEPHAKAGASEPENASSAALPAWAAKLVPNNQALIKGLIGIWTPDASGSIPASARPVFEKELVRSVLYVNEGPKARKEADKMFVYTDEASVKNAEGPMAKAVPVPPGLMIELALKRKVLLYVLYEEGNDGTSLFTALDENMLPDLLELAKAHRDAR